MVLVDEDGKFYRVLNPDEIMVEEIKSEETE
jgi:hypothetical protein